MADSLTGFANRLSIKRIFYSQGGKNYMLVGVPWNWLNSSSQGDLIIDPTTNAATNEDVRLYDAGNYGSDTKLAVGKFPNAGNLKSRSLIGFSLAGIPSNATVLKTQMKLKYYEKYNNVTGVWVDRWIQAHQMLVGWDEAQADSLKRLTGFNWGAPRGKIGGTNPDANGSYESSLLFVEDEALPVWKSWDLTALTQKWVSGATANYGVILWATNENTSGYVLRFYSSEATNTSDRPYLEVIWSQLPRTVYFLKDHLGSTRASVQDTATAPVVGYDDYDPWGYVLAGRSSITSGWGTQAGIMKNKFTSKEWDDEFGLNWYNFPARNYDPQIGRWMSVDPLAEKYLSLSPYVYVLDNPVAHFDPDGNFAVAIHYLMTQEILRSSFNYNQYQSNLLAHYASVFADNPSQRMLNFNNERFGTSLRFESDIRYSLTAKSQSMTDSEANMWHGMRSLRETFSMASTEAFQRGLAFGWNKIFESASHGNLGSFSKNGLGLQAFGQGIHALQDAMVHQGASWLTHPWLGDLDRSSPEFEAALSITQSAVIVHQILNGDFSGLQNVGHLDLSGMSQRQQDKIIKKIREAGYTVKIDEQ